MATFNDLFCNYRIAQTAIVADLGYKLVFAKTLFCGVYPTGVLSTPNGEYTFCGSTNSTTCCSRLEYSSSLTLPPAD